MIKIEQLLPLLKRGWVAMDKNQSWWWFEKEPFASNDTNQWLCDCTDVKELTAFDIEPAKDWTKSSMRCGDEQ